MNLEEYVGLNFFPVLEEGEVAHARAAKDHVKFNARDRTKEQVYEDCFFGYLAEEILIGRCRFTRSTGLAQDLISPEGYKVEVKAFRRIRSAEGLFRHMAEEMRLRTYSAATHLIIFDFYDHTPDMVCYRIRAAGPINF